MEAHHPEILNEPPRTPFSLNANVSVVQSGLTQETLPQYSSLSNLEPSDVATRGSIHGSVEKQSHTAVLGSKNVRRKSF